MLLLGTIKDCGNIYFYEYMYKNGYATMLKMYSTLFFLREPGGFQWSALAWDDLAPSYPYVNFFPPVNSVSWWQAHLNEIVFSALVRLSM